MPAFVAMTSRDKEASCGQIFYDFYWGSGFLPSRFQGVKFRGSGEPVLYLGNPDGMSRELRRSVLDDLARLNELKLRETGDPEIATRIAQYEMAFRMQTSVPGLMDVSREPANILDLYGCKPGDGTFASNCLLARRLAERGVRFIQLYHRDWDHHGSVKEHVRGTAAEVDQPIAALLSDLESRGLLDSTLVVWMGEFGRTPKINPRTGRDHFPRAFSGVLAGGGLKGGLVHGATTSDGQSVKDAPVSVQDLFATICQSVSVDPAIENISPIGRPLKIVDGGRPIQSLFA